MLPPDISLPPCEPNCEVRLGSALVGKGKTVTVTESELAAVLQHCRTLQAAADEVLATMDARRPWVEAALRSWRGPTLGWIRGAVADEEYRAQVCAARLRAEADGWAQFWADVLNAHNSRVGGVFQREPLTMVPVAPPPAAHNGYAPTGSLL